MTEEKKKRGRPTTKKSKKTVSHPEWVAKPSRNPNMSIDLNSVKGENTKYMIVNNALFTMPKIDITDPKQVSDRIIEYYNLYLQNDLRPTVSGLAMALNGHKRLWLWAVAHDQPHGSTNSNPPKLPVEVKDLIKQAYDMLEVSWESYMIGGVINPVTGIFLAKNNFGYKDQTETILTPNIETKDYNADDIRLRYLNDSND